MKFNKKALTILLKFKAKFDPNFLGFTDVYVDFKRGFIQVSNKGAIVRVTTKGDDSDVKGFFSAKSIKDSAKESGELKPELLEPSKNLIVEEKALENIRKFEETIDSEYSNTPTKFFIFPKHLVFLEELLNEVSENRLSVDQKMFFPDDSSSCAKFIAKFDDVTVTAVFLASKQFAFDHGYLPIETNVPA